MTPLRKQAADRKSVGTKVKVRLGQRKQRRFRVYRIRHCGVKVTRDSCVRKKL